MRFGAPQDWRSQNKDAAERMHRALCSGDSEKPRIIKPGLRRKGQREEADGQGSAHPLPQAWLTEIHEYAQRDVVIMLLGNKVSGSG